MDLSALLLSRLQFAFTVSFHIIFPSFTIGLAAWLTTIEALHLATGRPAYRIVFEFWLKIFGIAFGLGVVSGIVMAFEFGTNWSELSRVSGPIQGPLLTYETFTAFALEGSFFGVLLFGRGSDAISGTYLTKVINQHAAQDALFTADDGTALVWALRHIETGGKRRTFGSLLHATMASGMGSALGLQKSQPGRQVVCLAGDGGFAMLLGDLMTAVQENLPIKIAVYNNGKLGSIDIEQKSVGLIPVYTDLRNPNFGDVAKAMGLWGHQVSQAGELEESVKTWLAQPGPAVLNVKVKPMQLVTPPSPFVSPEAVVGMAVYTAKAMLHGKGNDVWEMVVENIP